MFAQTFLCWGILFLLNFLSLSECFGQKQEEKLELTASQAESLCKALDDSRIQNSHVYLWTSINANSREEKAPEQPELKKDCFKIRHVPCVGKARYPLTEDCGFYTLTPDAECSSNSNKRSTRSISTPQSLTLTNGQAAQICATLHNLPDEPFTMKYVPIKIDLNDNSQHRSDECVSWQLKPCQSGDEQEDKDGCWSMKIVEHENCNPFHDFNAQVNSTLLQKYPNRLYNKVDYLETYEKSEGPAWSAYFVQNLIACSVKSESGVVCKVVPESKGVKTKREIKTPETSILRVKRGCCSAYRCGPCGYSRYFGQRQLLCECSNRPDNLCENNGVCDLHEYPNGCYEECGVGK